MEKIKAIIVDDEESARDVLENLLKRFCPQVEILAKCENIPNAVEVINKTQPDLVFLDIEMPNYAGYEIVKFFEQINFEIIFVTAYDQYAIRAFEISAIDYLLKPVEIERLQQSVERVIIQKNYKDQINRLSVLSNTLESKQIKNLIIADKNQQHIIAIDSIIALEAHEAYTLIHTNEKQYFASKNLKHFETVLDSCTSFFRVHKSWIINKDFLLNYSKSDLTIQLRNNIQTKLSKYKKVEFEDWLK